MKYLLGIGYCQVPDKLTVTVSTALDTLALEMPCTVNQHTRRRMVPWLNTSRALEPMKY